MSRVTTKSKGILPLIATAAALACSQQAVAAGFQVREHSARLLGNAFAGTASDAFDASTNCYNAAGLSDLKHNQIVASGVYINPTIKLQNATATKQSGAVATGDTAKPKTKAFVPALHLAWKLPRDLTFGFSIYAPFGLKTVYMGDNIVRYVATESKLLTEDLSPSIAYKVNDDFSIGVGADFMRVKATLAADANVGLGEGYLINRGQGWGTGYHVGLLYKPSGITKMGLSYFSKFDPRLKGTATAHLTGSSPTQASAKLNLPDRIVYSITHQHSDEWTAKGDVEWVHWSRLKSVTVTYDNAVTPTSEYYFYKNSFRVSLGADYKYSSAWTLRGGLAWEQSPVTDAYRNARVPDSNRYWISIGAKYSLNKNLSVDAGYAHLFVKRVNIAQKGLGSATLNGNYKNSADLVGVQLTWNFV